MPRAAGTCACTSEETPRRRSTPRCSPRLPNAGPNEVGGRVWSYTHAWREVPRKSWGNVSVLASIEDPADAAKARAQGYQPAIVVDRFPCRPACVRGGGAEVRPVPAELSPKVTCVKCRLCLSDAALENRELGIAFALHGQHHNGPRQAWCRFARLARQLRRNSRRTSGVGSVASAGTSGRSVRRKQKPAIETAPDVEQDEEEVVEKKPRLPKFDPEIVEEAPIEEEGDVELEPVEIESVFDDADEEPKTRRTRRPRQKCQLTAEQRAALPRCPCCNRVKSPPNAERCYDCDFCKKVGEEWRSVGLCPKIKAKTIKKVDPKRAMADLLASKPKPFVPESRAVKPFRPKYEPF